MDNPFSSIASDLGRTVAQAKPLLLKLDNADTSTRPAEGKWAKKEILGHLSTRLPTTINALSVPRRKAA
jgi:hypothetical protein